MRHAAIIFLTLALTGLAPTARTPVEGAAQETGNEYVSGTYGFRVTWDDRLWYVIEQRFDGIVNGRDAVTPGDGAGRSGGARGDGHRAEAGLAVSDQVAVAHDEAGADAADAPVLALGQFRQVVQVKFVGRHCWAIYVGQ